MLRADERGEHNMSRSHGNHSAETQVAAVAGEVGQGSKQDHARRGDGRKRRLKGAGKSADERRGRRVPRAEGARELQPLQAHVAQGVAGGAQQRRKRIRLIYVQLCLLPRQVLLLAQHAPVRAPQGVFALEDGAARAEGRAMTDARLPGKFYRNAAQVEQQRGGCGKVYGQVHTFSTIVKTFFPN